MTEIYKTYVEVSVGLSIQDPNGDWEKTNIAIKTESGPGYPDAQTMKVIIQNQMNDAVNGANEQIEMVAKKIIEKVQRQ